MLDGPNRAEHDPYTQRLIYGTMLEEQSAGGKTMRTCSSNPLMHSGLAIKQEISGNSHLCHCEAGAYLIDADNFGEACALAAFPGLPHDIAEVGRRCVQEGRLLRLRHLLDDVPVIMGLGKVGARLASPRIPFAGSAEACQVGRSATRAAAPAHLLKLGREVRDHLWSQ